MGFVLMESERTVIAKVGEVISEYEKKREGGGRIFQNRARLIGFHTFDQRIYPVNVTSL